MSWTNNNFPEKKNIISEKYIENKTEIKKQENLKEETKNQVKTILSISKKEISLINVNLVENFSKEINLIYSLFFHGSWIQFIKTFNKCMKLIGTKLENEINLEINKYLLSKNSKMSESWKLKLHSDIKKIFLNIEIYSSFYKLIESKIKKIYISTPWEKDKEKKKRIIAKENISYLLEKRNKEISYNSLIEIIHNSIK